MARGLADMSHAWVFKWFKFCVRLAVLLSLLPGMAVSRLAAATRALVSVLLVFARSYLVVLEVNRDSPPEQVLKAYRKVVAQRA